MNGKQRESLAKVAYNIGQAVSIAGIVGVATAKVKAFGFVLLICSAALMVGIGLLLEREASNESGD